MLSCVIKAASVPSPRSSHPFHSDLSGVRNLADGCILQLGGFTVGGVLGCCFECTSCLWLVMMRCVMGLGQVLSGVVEPIAHPGGAMAEYVLEFCSTCAMGPRLIMMQHTMAMVPNSASALMMGIVCMRGKTQLEAILTVSLPPAPA